MNQLIRCVSVENLNLFRYATMVVVLLLGVSGVWADSSYYTAFTATSSNTAKGLVYASGPSTSTAPGNDEAYGVSKEIGQSNNTNSSSGTNKYYAWAKAARGYAFDGWTVSASSSSGGVSIDNANKAAGAKITVTSNVTNGTNTGTATAKWKDDPNAYTVTFGVPVDGSYTVTYSYTTIENNAFTTGGFNFSMTESSTVASGQQTSYAGDVVTVSSDASNFDGWYSNNDWAENHKLSGSTSYQFTVSGATSVYAKFKEATKYYGKVNASIAAVPYSMPGGGTIYISDIEGTSGVTFSENPQTAKITTYNSDATPPASVNQTYYLYAQPTDKRYVFRGWYDNATCTGTPLSTNASWAYTFAVSSHAENSPTAQTVYAAFDFNLYYMQVEVEPAVPGLGMVLVSDTKLTSPAYTEFSSESSQFAYAYRLTHTTDVYVYAKPKYGYKLSGWYSDAACTQAVTVASDGKYTASSTASTDPMNPDTITLYAKFVPATDGDKISLTYKIPDKTKGEYTASVLDITEVDDEYVWTFTEVYNSVDYTADKAISQHKTDVLRLEAACKAGYGVTSWTDAGTAKTTPSHLYETTGTATGKTYGVTFGDAKPFLVSTNSTQYATLAEALTAVGSSGKITVVQNAYVEPGDYTIPSGVSLIVPYESTGKTYTSPSSTYEKNQAFSSASQYVLLTLGSGVNITIAGSLYVMADLCSANGGGAGCGAPATAYGRIAMSENSSITINSNANLYCWGFITGTEGLVTVKNGGKVHEPLQHQNNPGGSKALAWNEKAFFMNQYYVQNVESPLKIEYGAVNQVYALMYIQGYQHANAALISKDNAGMFALTSSSSYLIRTYNPATDRTTYDIYGNAKLNYISMSVYIDIDTRNYVLPITSNLSVKCHTLNGTASTFNVPYAVSFLPGAELFVDEGVTVNISSKLIIYDRDEWIDKGFAEFNFYSGGTNWSRSSFTPTRTYTRTKADLVDAKVDLNGTMSVSGSLYTTTNGAAITSSNGTGSINLSAAAPGNSNDIQYASNNLGTSTNVAITPAKLLNADGSYLATAGAAKNDQFIYSKNLGIWMKNPKTVTWNANGGTTEATTMAYSEGAFIGELPAAYRDGYTLVGWFTSTSGGTQITQTTKVTNNITYYAHWTPKTYTITYKNQGESTFAGSTHIDTPNPHPTTHTFNTPTTLNGATRTHYTFGGWYKTVSCAGTVVNEIPASTCKNITLYAKWSPEEYTITYKDKGDVAFSGVHGDGYPTKHTYGTATTLVEPTKAEYVFDGWYTTSDCSTGKVTSLGATDYSAGITLYAKWTAAVASVTAGSTTYYKTLPEAFTAANGKNGNVTIKLLKSVDVTSATSSTPLKYNAAYTCTLDLNNYTITGTTGTVSGNPRMVQVDNNSATLIITDNSTDKGGKISMIRTGARGRYYGVQVTKGTLKVAGGTIYADNQTKWTKADDNGQRFGVDAIRLESGTSLEVTGGTIEAKSFLSARTIDADAGGATITISNGLLKATATATASNSSSCTQPNEAMEIYTAGGTTTISGGEFSSTVSKTASYNIYATDASQTITVSGGKFKVSGGTTTQNVNSAAAASSIDISGGYYSHEANLSKYTSAPYQIWSTTAEDKTEIGNDYNYKVVEAYTVTFNANGHGTAPAAQVIEKGKRATEPTAPTATGYTFDGWYKEAGCTNQWNFTSDVVTAATPLYAKWIPRNDTHYTVKHYKQKLDDSYATTPDDIDDLQGTTDASVTPERKNYAGFTAPAGQTVTILADGSRVVEYKYTRNSPNLSWSSNGGNALTGSYTTGSVKYGASITAPNDPTRTGYSFSGWSPAFTGTMPATDTEYKAQWTPEKRKVTWKDGTTTIKTEDLDYDSKPSYAYVKTPTAQYSFPLLKWEDEDTHVQYDPDNLPVVKNNVTYVAICDNVVNKYTVRFVNDQGTELQVISNIPYGDWPEYTGETPSSEIINDYYIREFKGWNPEIAEVADNTMYTARYEIVAKLDIKEEYVVPTNTIVETTTVEVGGSLNVANEKKLTTTDLIIEGSADEDWEEITSGEVVAVESAIEADNAYYDMRPEGGYKARIWYAVAVPWTVDVPTGVPGHVYDANGHALRLNIDFDLLYYDGAQRAAGGTNNWRYVAQEEAENQVMKPGKAYMIYLASPTSKLRFEKSSGNWLTKELPLEHYAETTGNDGKDANWNGIANPAIYRAYLNAGTDGNWGQVFVPGSAPRDGGTYAPVDMSTYKLAVGQPIFVQAENTEKGTVIAYRSNDDYLSHAPRRAQADAAEQEARYAVEIAVNGKRGDRIFIATNDDKEDAYTIGSDVVKMGWSSTKPQMWINRYGSKLCVNTVEFNGSSATYPLMIQIPSEGEYSIYTPSEILSGHELYITYNGRAIWNLSYAPFEGTFAAGTHAEYGLKLVRSKLPTDIEQTNAGQEDVRKVLIDDHVYIIRGGAVFSIDGQLVK